MEIMNWKKNINPALDSNKIVYYFGDSIYCENKDNQVAFEISLKTQQETTLLFQTPWWHHDSSFG